MRGINHSGSRWGRVGDLAARQHGVASREQLRRLGIGDGAIEKAVARGWLHPVFRGTFGVGYRTDRPHARMMAAVLACGRGSVVSHLSAAWLLGLRDRSPVAVEAIASGDSGRRIDGIRRHYVPAPRGHEKGHCDAIPCTSPSRTVVDLAGMLGERALGKVVEKAAVHGTLDVTDIEGIMATSRRRGAPLLRRVLHNWRPASPADRGDGGKPDLRSELEARLLALINAAGIPTPRCNRPIALGGKRLTVDFLWPEQRLVVETDGRLFHDNPVAFERDRLRDRALQVAGYRVLRFTSAQIGKEPEAAIAAIRRLLAGDFG